MLSSFEGLQIDSGHSLLVQGPPTPDKRQSQEQVRALQCPQNISAAARAAGFYFPWFALQSVLASKLVTHLAVNTCAGPCSCIPLYTDGNGKAGPARFSCIGLQRCSRLTASICLVCSRRARLGNGHRLHTASLHRHQLPPAWTHPVSQHSSHPRLLVAAGNAHAMC